MTTKDLKEIIAISAEATKIERRRCLQEIERLKALMRRALPTIESRLTDYEDEFRAACEDTQNAKSD